MHLDSKTIPWYLHNLYFSMKWCPSRISCLAWSPDPPRLCVTPPAYFLPLFSIFRHIYPPLCCSLDVFLPPLSFLCLYRQYLHVYCWYLFGCNFYFSAAAFPFVLAADFPSGLHVSEPRRVDFLGFLKILVTERKLLLPKFSIFLSNLILVAFPQGLATHPLISLENPVSVLAPGWIGFHGPPEL